MRLNQVTLPAIDVAASVAFYQRMGFELIVDAPHYARFKSMEGDTTFSVHKVDLLVEASQTVVYFETSSLDETVHRLQRKGFFFSQALFVLLSSLGNLIHIPGLIFLAAAVLALGRLWGGAVTYVAAVVSCALTFLMIRALGGSALRLLENRVAVRLLSELDARPIACIALLRVFFQTAPALNYALAMSGIRFRTYLVGTLMGLPAPIALYCLFFDILAAGLGIR